MINDLGNEKTYVEAGVINLFYYYPGPTVTTTFNTVSLVCVDGGAVFTFLDVFEEETTD